MKQAKLLSKSRLKEGIQCPKALFFSLHQPEFREEVSAATQAQFDEGNEVGELARKHFGKGVLVETDHWEIDKALEITQAQIKAGEKTIFEASFSDGEIYCRVDILTRSSVKGKWRIIEVKKSSDVKDDHLNDIGLQALVLQRCGIKIESYSIMHLNRDCVFPDLSDLFVTQDVTAQVTILINALETKVESLLKLRGAKKEPKNPIGRHCNEPFDCAYREHCWAHIPEYSVFELPGVGPVKGHDLLNKGLLEIKSLKPSDFTGNTRRAIEVTKSKKRFVDIDGIGSAIESWKYPLYFLDFETVNPAIPRYKGTSPYFQIPFQFSCHVLQKPGAKIAHFEYLHLETSDPREPLTKALASCIGAKGSVVSYNKGFEASVISKLAALFPKYEKALRSIIERLVDPLPVFRKHVYDREFRGDFSMKMVAPAILGEKFSYADLEVGDGTTAGAWANGILRGQISGKEFDVVRGHLLTYCRQDTLAMMELVNWLSEIADGSPK
jgi:predicted RecB family nuclease